MEVAAQPKQMKNKRTTEEKKLLYRERDIKSDVVNSSLFSIGAFVRFPLLISLKRLNAVLILYIMRIILYFHKCFVGPSTVIQLEEGCVITLVIVMNAKTMEINRWNVEHVYTYCSPFIKLNSINSDDDKTCSFCTSILLCCVLWARLSISGSRFIW